MNASETGGEKLNMEERAVESARGFETPDNLQVNNPELPRERASTIGNVVLASGNEQEKAQELATERVEEMVSAENRLGEEARAEAAMPQVETLVMPQIQGKIDKAAVSTLEQMASRDGNYPGRLEAEVNDLRRKYLEGWRMAK